MVQIKQTNKTKSNKPESIVPVQAVQPITGGIAPTIDPNHVLMICFLFIGV